MKNVLVALAGIATMTVSAAAFSGSTAPPGVMRAVSASINAGTHQGNALAMSQKRKGLLQVVGKRYKIYDECLSTDDACGATVVNPSNEHGGKTLEVMDSKLGKVHVVCDAQGFVVEFQRRGA